MKIITKLEILATKGWKSRTVWLGYLTMALAAAQEVLAQFQVVLKPHTYAIIGACLGALIVMMRLLTKLPVENK